MMVLLQVRVVLPRALVAGAHLDTCNTMDPSHLHAGNVALTDSCFVLN